MQNTGMWKMTSDFTGPQGPYGRERVKSVERIRRAGGVECVDLNEISAEIQIPKKLEKFRKSPANKTNLQQRGLSLASSTPVFAQQDVLRSGCVTDEGIVPAQLYRLP